MLGRRCLPRVSRAVLGPRWGPPGGRAAGARAGRSQAGPSAQAPLAVVSVVLPEALPAGTGLGAPWGAAAGPSRIPGPRVCPWRVPSVSAALLPTGSRGSGTEKPLAGARCQVMSSNLSGTPVPWASSPKTRREWLRGAGWG